MPPTLISSFSLASAIGINTDSPNKALTVVGDISASGNVYSNGSQLGAGSGTITSVTGTTNQITATTSNGAVTISLPSFVSLTDLTVGGNFTTTGSATFISTKNLVVGDNLIYLNDNNTGNTFDTGFVSHFTQAPLGYNHTGFVRRAGQGTPGTWTLFSGLTSEPLTGSNINWNDTTLTLDTLSANIITPGVAINTQVQFLTGNNFVKVYQYYNSSTNSLDTVFN